MESSIVIRLQQDLKQLAVEKAKQSGKTISEVVREFLEDFVKPEKRASAAGICDDLPLPDIENSNIWEEEALAKFEKLEK